MITILGICLVLLALTLMFFMDDTDPYQHFFPWLWTSLRLMLYAGSVITIMGAIYQTWRFLA